MSPQTFRSIDKIITSHKDPKFKEWHDVILENSEWQINPTDTGDLTAQCTDLGGSELDEEWDVLVACEKDAHVYGLSLSKQDDWEAKRATIAGTAHSQEHLMLHLVVFPVGLHVWCGVHGLQQFHQVQAQIIHRAQKVLEQDQLTPAHRKAPIEGTTVLAAIAFPHHFLTSSPYSAKKQRHLIHHVDDHLCVWTPSKADMELVRQHGFKITCISGRRGWLSGQCPTQHAHWTKVDLPEVHHGLLSLALEHIPGVLPFEVQGRPHFKCQKRTQN